MTLEYLEKWFPRQYQSQYISLLMGRVGLTRRRAECFIKLWAYLWLKQQKQLSAPCAQPIQSLELPQGWVSCTCREAADLFYADSERGSDRAAGMMLDKLAALGLIKKTFDGNTLAIAIEPLPELRQPPEPNPPATIQPDAFDPRCDAIPVANLLATFYNWMNRNTDAVPYRIAELLRGWASQYVKGMRVLRRDDNFNPVGFYLLYPTKRESEVNFFGPPSKGLHLSAVSDIDPFEMALPGDLQCRSIFVRSWMIDTPYRDQAQITFLEDAQQTLSQMRRDFPHLCDLHTLIIHPSLEELAQTVGFQKNSSDSQSSVYWMYLALDRFLATDISQAFKLKQTSPLRKMD